MPRHHHVNLGLLPDQLDQEAEWLTDVLGYERLDAGEELTKRGACWFVGEDGGQIHLSRDEQHNPPRMAHVAVELDDLPALGKRLEALGVPFTASSGAGVQVLICNDPAGNRWELRAPAS